MYVFTLQIYTNQCLISKKGMLFLDLVTELLGSDLMEHNILHSGIGIDEALEILNRNISFLR